MLKMFSNRLTLLAHAREFCYLLSSCVSGNIGSGDFWEYIPQRMTTEFLPLERESGLIHQRSCLMCSVCTYFSENGFIGQDSFSSKWENPNSKIKHNSYLKKNHPKDSLASSIARSMNSNNMPSRYQPLCLHLLGLLTSA